MTGLGSGDTVLFANVCFFYCKSKKLCKENLPYSGLEWLLGEVKPFAKRIGKCPGKEIYENRGLNVFLIVLISSQLCL